MSASPPVALLALLGASLLAGVAPGSQAPAPPAMADGRVPVLVELFTSEGCSSCPPADALLRDLIAAQPVDGALVIGLSEHVDYWNRLGWTDPFSDRLFSERQSAYATTAKSDQVYTPQMVVDGQVSFVGSDRERALTEVASAARRAKASVELRQATSGDLGVHLDEGLAPANTPVWMAITEDGLVVSVARGENANRTLSHDGVTHQLTRIGRTARSGGFDKTMPIRLKDSWRPDATRVIVFAQETGGPIVALGAMRIRGR